MLKLLASRFPQKTTTHSTMRRVFVVYRPVLGSVEQFVIGVVVIGKAGRHLERANRLARLEGLYGAQAPGAILAIEIALGLVESAIGEESFDPSEFRPGISGLFLLDDGETEGRSPSDLAVETMKAMSSLYGGHGLAAD